MSGWRSVVRVSIGVVVAVLLYGLFCPSYALPKEFSYKSYCISNMKQMGTSMLFYLADNDNRFPATDWIDAVKPYAKYEEMFTCPEVSALKQKWGYAMNLELVGISATKVVDPVSKPMLFETDALARNVVANLQARNLDRHRRQGAAGSVIGRADSSTKFIRADTPLPD